MTLMRTLIATTVFAGAMLGATAAEAATVCVYDPAGKSGNYYRLMEDFAVDSAEWGASITIKPYTDEATAASDYEAGACDGVLATGVRLQRFNRFPSTIEAIGAIPEYAQLKKISSTLSTSAGAAKKLTSGEHETVGFVSVGAAYLFVQDRSWDTVSELGGKSIATMDYDKAAPVMVERVGGVMVPADLGSIGPKFNNNDVNACYMSAPGYKPFELEKGLQDDGKGGIIRAPLAQGTLQLIVRHGKFPEGFGPKSRTWFHSKFDSMLKIVTDAEAQIPASLWIDIPPDRLDEWNDMFVDVRVKLRDDVKAYDGQMLGVLKSNRCTADSSRAECAEERE